MCIKDYLNGLFDKPVKIMTVEEQELVNPRFFEFKNIDSFFLGLKFESDIEIAENSHLLTDTYLLRLSGSRFTLTLNLSSYTDTILEERLGVAILCKLGTKYAKKRL